MTGLTGAELTWEWEMYSVSSRVRGQGSRTGPAHPLLLGRLRSRASHHGRVPVHPYENDTTYLHITETGFTGDADTQVSRVLDSTQGFTFLLSALKAALEHDVTLRVTIDAHPPSLQIPEGQNPDTGSRPMSPN